MESYRNVNDFLKISAISQPLKKSKQFKSPDISRYFMNVVTLYAQVLQLCE